VAVLGVATTDGRCRADPSAATPPNTATLRQVEAHSVGQRQRLSTAIAET